MTESMYVEGYLDENRRRGYGKGLTPGTYIAYNVRGRARDYASRYVSALINALERRGAVKGRSACASIAYYPADMVPR